MLIPVDEIQLKALFKSVFAEVMAELCDLIHDAVEEALEDIALARAIQEGENSETVSREEIFQLFKNAA